MQQAIKERHGLKRECRYMAESSGKNCTYHVAPYAGIPEALEELKDEE